MSEKTQDIIGKLLDGTAGRDAIHIAVAPVKAAGKLFAGQHIGFVDGSTEEVGVNCDKPIGIVDPFLKDPVYSGSRFFMFLYPNTITSLRHEWTHPAFGDAPAVQPRHVPDKAASEAWLRDFCDTHNCPGFETLMEIIAADGDWSDGSDYRSSSCDGEYLIIRGQDAGGDIPDEFWTHVEIVLGKSVSIRPNRFSCSC